MGADVADALMAQALTDLSVRTKKYSQAEIDQINRELAALAYKPQTEENFGAVLDKVDVFTSHVMDQYRQSKGGSFLEKQRQAREQEEHLTFEQKVQQRASIRKQLEDAANDSGAPPHFLDAIFAGGHKK